MSPITTFDDASVMWIDTDYIYQNLKLPLSTFQQILFSIPSKHRKMINDVNSSSCPFPPNNTVKYMVDIYGAAVLALKSPCAFSDQLLTTFIANNYLNYCNRPPRPPSCQPPPHDDCCQCQRQIMEALEKINHQNELLINGVNQISLNQSSQFLELTNALCAVRGQNAQLITLIENLKDTLLCRLETLMSEIKNWLPEQTAKLEELANKLTDAINNIQQTLRTELNNTNSILTNLASSITNINSTLNNILNALENISGGNNDNESFTDEDREKLNLIYELVKEIKNILMVGASRV
ncbi:calyx/pep [Oxyplax ochracea nucleopolyhedrovirus]|uniref:Calyx/pep n=1 Tax=Oxyplax ochracea nucleopolyhedrovirus TaxID=2083176 RepID=A0A2L0WTZ9_9ABAC|nr:calyx/pep [Oxyplax ochracea nucleopolyhedrovirus]AVA31121.1 calyx/pep [Oxyplax ochracea nucleopolyhedrovirus]